MKKKPMNGYIILGGILLLVVFIIIQSGGGSDPQTAVTSPELTESDQIQNSLPDQPVEQISELVVTVYKSPT